jgi:hypothetical protein
MGYQCAQRECHRLAVRRLQFIAAGPVYQTLGLGYLAFQLVKPGRSAPEGSGFDVAIVRNGFIVELYTVLTETNEEAS